MINLVRLGHYFTPTSSGDEEVAGSCRTALVVSNSATDSLLADAGEEAVGLAVWNHNGGQEIRRSVMVVEPINGEDSFHLSGDCPWKR